MESSRDGDNRPLRSQIQEVMEIEELKLNVKKLKKNMTYVIKFLQYQLAQMPIESAEEEEQITKERNFINHSISELSNVVITLSKEQLNNFDPIDSGQFVTILDEYKNIFTDILIGSRSLSDEKDARLVSKSALTINTSKNYKNVLAAIDQLVDVYYNATLSDYFKHAVQEKDFSFLINMKNSAKMHYGVNDQEAAGKLKMIFNNLFSAEKYQELRSAFFVAVNDPAIGKNLTALQESCEYKEEKSYRGIYETEEDRKLDIKDDSSEIENKRLWPEVEEKDLHIEKLKQQLKTPKEIKLREIQPRIAISVRSEEQLGPGTYEVEKEKFKEYLSKLEDKSIGKKAKDVLTAVKNAKNNNIASEAMLIDTLFLTNQFLGKIISGKEINDRMCFDYGTLAKNLNKNPLGKRIAGAMTAFLGAVILVLPLSFMEKTGLKLLNKGIIQHQGTKSIAENSQSFLEEVKSKSKKMG